jgi:hypothetical protein
MHIANTAVVTEGGARLTRVAQCNEKATGYTTMESMFDSRQSQCPDCSGPHPLFARGWPGSVVAQQVHLAPTLRMSGAVPPLH